MIEQLEALALKSVVLKDHEYFCRKVYRYYSEKFHTPLTDVYNLSWSFVFTNYLEHIMETSVPRKELIEMFEKSLYPEIEQIREDQLQNLIKNMQKTNPPNKQETNPPNKQEVESKEINMDSTLFEHLDEEMEQE